MDNPRLAIGQKAYDYFVRQGLAPHQAAAFAGNVAWESGGRTDGINIGDNKKYPAAPHSFGISQWNGDRLARLVDYARSQGADIPAGSLADPNYLRAIAPKLPLDTQLGYAWQEMQGPEAKALAGVKNAGDIRAATASALGFYRPLGWHPTTPEAGHGFPDRLALASKILAAGPGAPAPEQPYDMYGEAARPAPAAAPAAPAAPAISLPGISPAPERPAANDRDAIVAEITQRLKEENEDDPAKEALRFGSWKSPMGITQSDDTFQMPRAGRMDLSKLRNVLASRNPARG